MQIRIYSALWYAKSTQYILLICITTISYYISWAMLLMISFSLFQIDFTPLLRASKHHGHGRLHYLCQEPERLSSRPSRIRVGVNNGKKERTDQVRTLDWSADWLEHVGHVRVTPQPAPRTPALSVTDALATANKVQVIPGYSLI